MPSGYGCPLSPSAGHMQPPVSRREPAGRVMGSRSEIRPRRWSRRYSPRRGRLRVFFPRRSSTADDPVLLARTLWRNSSNRPRRKKADTLCTMSATQLGRRFRLVVVHAAHATARRHRGWGVLLGLFGHHRFGRDQQALEGDGFELSVPPVTEGGSRLSLRSARRVLALIFSASPSRWQSGPSPA